MTIYTPPPQPPVKPITGNLSQMDTDAPVQSLMGLAETYGPFFKLKILDRELYIASNQELVNELCDETRFVKRVHPVLNEIRAFAGDGLFTAFGTEPNWAKAHRILMPAFGPIGVRDMFDDMLDIADQMFTRWERFGPDVAIDVPDNMTRLTLDTIALCGFGYRFNSFYSDNLHPFVGAMVGALAEAGMRTRRPSLVSQLMVSTARRFQSDVDLMNTVSQQLIDQRRKDPDAAAKNDLLNRMLNGKDPETGEGLSDDNIANQMITFLIAGHETTSGLLSFTTYLLLKNPDVLAKARAAVDQVLGDRMPRIEDMAQLRYLEQVLMESLRLWPTAPAFGVQPLQDTVLAGQYPLTPEDTVMVLTPTLHRDRSVWGADAETFRPERFAPDQAATLPPNAWKPFGNGARACIGRPFAMQEAQLVLAMMLQRFDFSFDDPAYRLKIHETLTLKPENLKIRVRPRRTAKTLTRTPGAVTIPAKPAAPSQPATAPQATTDLLVLYGSNTGSAQAFAQRIAKDAPHHGFAATVAPMDDYTGKLPRNGALVLITASYEGQPPDNARHFVPYAESLPNAALSGLHYIVFGCGNRQWARTFQAIPKRMDAALNTAGATRLLPRGEADSGGDFFGAFDDWYTRLWPTLADAFDKDHATPTTDPLELELLPGIRETTLRLPDLHPGTVVENRELVDMSAPNARSKRHIEFRLPPGMTYRAGDYLAVLPSNPDTQVNRALRRFGLAADTLVKITRPGTASSLPVNQPVSAGDLLANYVELAQPATRAQVQALSDLTRCPPEKAELTQLAGGAYEAKVLAKRVSLLDLLERFESAALDFSAFLEMLPPLKPRQYSISSSPRWNPDHVTLTVAVVDAPALSGQGQYRGVASTYLAGLRSGDRVSIAVRPSNARFHPPADPATPMILICAGSGLAPFRGFLQDRAEQKAVGEPVAPSLLYFGTNHPDVDYLYQQELASWEQTGIVTVLPVFTDQPQDDMRFVQHRLWADRARVAETFRQGANVYVCGDGKYMAPAVHDTLVKIYSDTTGSTEQAAQDWAHRAEHEQGRYVADVFA